MEFGAEDIFQYASDMGNWLMDTAVVPPSVSIHDGLMGRRGLGKGKQPNFSLLGNLEEPGTEVLWPEEETPTFRSIIFFCARYFKSVGGRGGVLMAEITENNRGRRRRRTVFIKNECCTMPYLLRVREASFVPLYPTYRSCSRSFGLRSSYEIDILDTDQRPGTLDC